MVVLLLQDLLKRVILILSIKRKSPRRRLNLISTPQFPGSGRGSIHIAGLTNGVMTCIASRPIKALEFSLCQGSTIN